MFVICLPIVSSKAPTSIAGEHFVGDQLQLVRLERGFAPRFAAELIREVVLDAPARERTEASALAPDGERLAVR